MNPLVHAVRVHLPSLPIPVGSLDGVNLDSAALKPRTPGLTAEQAIVEFRGRLGPETCRYSRRYYLQPVTRGGQKGHLIKYVWNLDEPRSDRILGHVVGDDLPAIRAMIGNAAAGSYMTGIRWELCEDREGEEPFALGRFDAWSLLQDVTAQDLERLAARGTTPRFEGWDFDRLYLGRPCPGCSAAVAVNILAFNIDSARCALCGVRPHLSRLLGERLRLATPSVTGGTALLNPTDAVLQTVRYLGLLDASMSEIAFPDSISPQAMLVALLEHSDILPSQAQSGNPSSTLEWQLSKLDEQYMLTARGAAQIVERAVRGGEPFNDITSKAADFLDAILQHQAPR